MIDPGTNKDWPFVTAQLEDWISPRCILRIELLMIARLGANISRKNWLEFTYIFVDRGFGEGGWLLAWLGVCSVKVIFYGFESHGTPPKFNCLPLKHGGWKTSLSYWVSVTFQGRAVKLRRVHELLDSFWVAFSLTQLTITKKYLPWKNHHFRWHSSSKP